MKLTKKLEAEIKQVMDSYWSSYLAGDLKTWASFLPAHYKNIGTTQQEIWHSKKAIIDYSNKVAAQLTGMAEMRNKTTEIIPYPPYMMVHELGDMYINTKNNWTFYAKLRLSSLIEKTTTGWKILHQHGSYPDSKTKEGETFAFDKISKENLQLKDAIKRRTIEIENKNRELEIEASLERVRTVAMSMHKPQDLLGISKAVFKELQLLQFTDLRNAIIHTYSDEQNAFLDYDYADFTKGYISNIPYKGNSIIEKFIRDIRKSKDAFTEIIIKGKELKQWQLFRNANNEAPDERLSAATALYYYVYSIGNASIGISTFKPVPAEKLEVLKRFRNVFDLAYQRYLDITSAEAQAREAQIEAALERVRSRGMAMHRSDELAEAAQLLYREFRTLNITTLSCGYSFIDEATDSQTVWTVLPDGTLVSDFIVFPLAGDEVLNSRYKDWKEKIELHTYEIQGEANKEHHQFLSQFVPVYVVKEIFAKLPDRIVFHCANFSDGYLFILATEFLHKDDQQTIIRFSRVFQQTYTRFLDLQKAEAQSRDAQIQLSLERVRARTMAMQKSDELAEAASLLFQQVKSLGIETFSSGYTLWENDNLVSWMCNADGSINPPFTMPVADEPWHLQQYESWKKGEDFIVNDLSGKRLQTYFSYLRSFPLLDEAFKISIAAGHPMPDRQIHNVANFSYGNLLFITYEAVPEAHDIFKRFAKVFEQTYTRFLDLQKAEAQAREAQIELGLERVRARAMAMQNSDELKELIGTVYTELTRLDLILDRCFIMIYDIETMGVTWWMSNPEVPLQPIGLFVRYHEQPPYLAFINAWKERRLIWQYILEGTVKKNWDSFLFVETELSRLPGFVIDNMKTKEKVYLSASFNNFGCLTLASLETLSNEHFDILLRFAKVFDLTYTRFNDLQKAEAQAREAQIELGLERVRARAMAMQKSDELKALIGTVFTELTKLDLVLTRCVIMIYELKTQGSTWWMANSEAPSHPIGLYIKYHNAPPYVAYINAWQQRKHKWQYILEGTDKKEWDDFLFSQTELSHLPDFVIEGMKEPDKVYLNASFNSFGNLTLATLQPLSNEHFDIMLRFAKVFDLTYTRFNDLKQAEAQAKESQIQLALERVRARTMAMQKSDELPEAANLLFQQVQSLGMPAWSTGYCIWSHDQSAVTLYMSSEGILQPPFTAPTTEDELFIQMRKGKEAGKTFHVVEMGGDELVMHYRYMRTLPVVGKILDSIIAAGHPLPTFQVMHHAYFSKGFLLFITYEPVPDAHDIFERFGKVFDQTYTRFLDLQKAEAQAREAHIETALERIRSRTMAMQKSEELTNVAGLLFEQVNALGIKTWTAGFNVWSEDNNSYVDYITSPNGGFIEPYTVDTEKAGALKDISNARKSGVEFDVQYVDGEKIKQLYLALTGLGEKQFEIMLQDGVRFPSQQYEHFVFGSKVSLMFITYEPVPEAHDIFKRLGKVFEQTYTRFLDLQKAEAQAREAEIQLALERVRARSLAMHRTSELQDVVDIVAQQLYHIGMDINGGVIITINEQVNDDLPVWASSGAADYVQRVVVPFLDRPIFTHLRDAIKRGNNFFAEEYNKEEKDELFNHLSRYNPWRSSTEERKKELLSREGGLARAAAISHYTTTAVTNHHGKKFSDEDHEILKRFGNVFEQSYTRFLDLQKAEAQAKEAQIETALERVRSRSLAMQKSEELKEIIKLVYEQLVHLNMNVEHAGFIMDYKERNDMHIWLADQRNIPSEVTIPYFDSPHWNSFINAKEKGENFFTNLLSLEEKNKFYNDLFHLFPVPDEAKEYYFSCAGLAITTVLLDNVGLYIENFSGTPFTDEENSVLMRLGKVFQQTYTRFNDLQKAEAQAREAQIELGLERVRARAMAMQNSDELSEMVAILFEELVKLDLILARCIIWIFDTNSLAARMWMANSEDKKIARSYFVKYLDHPYYNSILTGWKEKNQKWVYDLKGEEKKTIDRLLLIETELSQLPETVKEGILSSEETFVAGSFNNFGLIEASGPANPTNEQLDILHRFGKVFDLSYTRFNDLQKAEEQALRAEQDLIAIKEAKQKAEEAFTELQATQKQLIQSEKMASLGELTAGIAHEIQNPLNFVNNFSEVSKELLDEMRQAIENGNAAEAKEIMNDVIDNLEKINHHGKRADGIVKGMLQHSRSSSNVKEPTNINALADEYLRLAYHGLRAKEKSFNATLETDYDTTVGKIEVIPQDIGRVILNLITNAFYAVKEKSKTAPPDYKPTVCVSTKRSNDAVIIAVKDNGNGIPQNIVDKIFQPFFTTKPTGQGTGLGLSLAYDIVKTHGGELEVHTSEKEGTEFIIIL